MAEDGEQRTDEADLHSAGWRQMLQHLRDHGLVCTSILDVGAHRGAWARAAKAVFPAAACLLIEPQPALGPTLDAFIQVTPNARYVLAAAGATPGSLRLTFQPEMLEGGTLRGPGAFAWSHGTPELRAVVVPVVTIDELLARGELAPPELVKVDVQGYELEALRGASRLFGAAEAFIIETSFFAYGPAWPLFHEVVAFMAARGYVAYAFGELTPRLLDGALGQADVCFAREPGVLRRRHGWL